MQIPNVIPRREVLGMSAILLPLSDDHRVAWDDFQQHVQRTAEAGLWPAVNMDTGYGPLIDASTRAEVLQRTGELCGSRPWVAGAWVGDRPGDPFSLDAYRTAIDLIEANGGIPVIFQSYGLSAGPDAAIVDRYGALGTCTKRMIGFELAKAFAPFGSIYSIDVFRQLLSIPSLIGAKHSSLCRQQEWNRLTIRNSLRPDFRLLTGNDLAIDMVIYGSDYLLGLSTMAPDAFALRDRYWRDGDPHFWRLNDLLQYLGCFTFRHPTPAYKHSAAMFLQLRGWIQSAETWPGSPRRPDTDRAVLALIWDDLKTILEQA
jgi:dihydrodipicolinate synthase/N-acetylneuraminate lyase